MKNTITILMLVVLLSFKPIYANNFDVVFMADLKYAGDDSWLSQIKSWGATGVNVVFERWAIDTLGSNYEQWVLDSLFTAMNKISAPTTSGGYDLDIYIRISMGTVLKNKWCAPPYGTNAGGYNYDDFHQTLDTTRKNILYDNYNWKNGGQPILNITSPRARGDMIRFFSDMVDSINAQPASVKNRVKLIVPAISPDDEMEFPSAKWSTDGGAGWGYMSGYSSYEKTAFYTFLTNKYDNIYDLNSMWDTTFTSFGEIELDSLKFHYGYDYTLEAGRKDFIDFRTSELKKFIDDCSDSLKAINPNFNFGIQFGSIYDAGLEYKGFYDFTPLVENVDHFIIDDIPQYVNNFNFSADFARSVCNYWNNDPNRSSDLRDMTFSTESNWPEYNDFGANFLTYYWNLQLQKYYQRGASSLFLSHWGTAQKDAVAQGVINGTLTNYNTWKNYLNSIKTQNIITNINYNGITHLSCEQGLYSRSDSPDYWMRYKHNTGIIDTTYPSVNFYEFPLITFTKPRYFYDLADNTNYRGHGDFITNYMIKKTPNYIHDHYDKLYLTGTSYYMPLDVYNTLQNLDDYYFVDGFIIDNETYTNNGPIFPELFTFVPGTKTDYNKTNVSLDSWNYSSLHKINSEYAIDESEFEVLQNYPNPFNPITTIKYTIPSDSHVDINIYNSLGQKIQTIFSGIKKAGNYSEIFNGSKYSSGIYCFSISANGRTIVKKLSLIK